VPSMSVRPASDCFCQAVPFGPALKLGSWRNWDVFDMGASRGLMALLVGVLVTALRGHSWWRTVGVAAVLVGAATMSTTVACAGTAVMLNPSKSAAGHAAIPRMFKGPSQQKNIRKSRSSGKAPTDPPREQGGEF